MLIEATIEVTETSQDFHRILCDSLAPEIKEEEKMARGIIRLYCNEQIIISLKASKKGDLQALMSSYLGLLKLILDVYKANL